MHHVSCTYMAVNYEDFDVRLAMELGVPPPPARFGHTRAEQAAGPVEALHRFPLRDYEVMVVMEEFNVLQHRAWDPTGNLWGMMYPPIDTIVLVDRAETQRQDHCGWWWGTTLPLRGPGYAASGWMHPDVLRSIGRDCFVSALGDSNHVASADRFIDSIFQLHCHHIDSELQRGHPAMLSHTGHCLPVLKAVSRDDNFIPTLATALSQMAKGYNVECVCTGGEHRSRSIAHCMWQLTQCRNRFHWKRCHYYNRCRNVASAQECVQLIYDNLYPDPSRGGRN